MHEIYELKEKLMRELEEYGTKEMSAGSLEIVDKLAHAIKNLCKIIEAMEEEEGYSERGGNSYEGGGGNRNSYEGGGNRNSYRGGGNSYRGGSYARGRGRNARRDSMGRYSREGGYSRTGDEMVEQLQELMQEAPNDQIRQDIQRLVIKLEQQM